MLVSNSQYNVLTSARNPALLHLEQLLESSYPWDNFTMTDPQNYNGKSCCQITSLNRWNAVFRSFQLLSVRHTSGFRSTALGRFWRNPYLQIDDFPFSTLAFFNAFALYSNEQNVPPQTPNESKFSIKHNYHILVVKLSM